VTTLGRRVPELQRLLASIEAQAVGEIETIIVDQSDDGALERAMPATPGVRWLRSSRGASRGRNVGIAVATGDVIGFPDDDCWYDPQTLVHVLEVFDKHPEVDGVSAIARDASGRASTTRFDGRAGPVRISRVWSQGIEFGTFFRREAILRLGGFDEALGPGAATPLQAGEGTDLIARALRSGMKVEYRPGITVRHEHPEMRGAAAHRRVREYSRGTGHVLRARRFPLWVVLAITLRSFAGIAAALVTGDPDTALRRWHSILGRAEGYLGRQLTSAFPPEYPWPRPGP
jgi:glycosyltransferase involved in cell wall biosynthesis